MPDLVNTLEKETGVALSWLENNEMIANPENFHAILLRKSQTNTIGEQININGKMIKSEETVKLLGVTLDYRLDFDPHISNICKKAAAQLNVLERLKALLALRKNRFLFRALFIQILITVPWCGIFHLQNHYRKLKRYKNAL